MPPKRVLRRLLDGIGLDVSRPEPRRLEVAWRGSGQAGSTRRGTLRGSLENMAAAGLVPETVVDVGAAHGTPELYDTFPRAFHLLVEPLEEFSAALRRVGGRLERAAIFTGTAGAVSGKAVLNVHRDLVGSSLYKEDEDSDVNGVERSVEQTTLDQLRRRHEMSGPFLLKIDTQGAELEVLKGADTLLTETEAIVLEVSMFDFFVGGPGFFDVCDYLRARGFVPYDIVDLQYRPLDNALSQIDMVFVRKDSSLRRDHFYATRRQREKQDRAFGHSRRQP